jgi:hypothetical protein
MANLPTAASKRPVLSLDWLALGVALALVALVRVGVLRGVSW